MRYSYYVVYLAKKEDLPLVQITGGAVIQTSIKIESNTGIGTITKFIEQQSKMKEVIILNWKRIKIYPDPKKAETTSSVSSAPAQEKKS